MSSPDSLESKRHFAARRKRQLTRQSILFRAPRDDPQRVVGKRPLRRHCLPRGCGHPRVDLPLRQNERHGLGVNRRDNRIRLSRQEREEIVRRLALLDLADRRPARPNSGEEGERAAFDSVTPASIGAFSQCGPDCESAAAIIARWMIRIQPGPQPRASDLISDESNAVVSILGSRFPPLTHLPRLRR